MIRSEIKDLSWSSKSPDLNIVEDIWKIISDQVHDGPQFVSIHQLSGKVKVLVYILTTYGMFKMSDLVNEVIRMYEAWK